KLGARAHEAAGARGDQAVARVARPAERASPVAVVTAELADEVEVAERAGVEHREVDRLEVEPEVDAAHLVHRVAELDAATERVGGVRADGKTGSVGLALVNIEALAHAVHRVIRIEVRERVHLVDRAAIDVEREELA